MQTAEERGEKTDAKAHGGYGAPGQPLEAYATLMGLYGIAFGGFVAAVRSGRFKIPDRVSLEDVLLIGIAAHKVTRIAALDEVTSAIRAPFTQYEGQGDAPAEVKEKPRGRGFRKAIGTLLTCPYCLAPWAGTVGFIGLAVAPRITRAVATVFTVAAVSDWLNTAYDHAWKD